MRACRCGGGVDNLYLCAADRALLHTTTMAFSHADHSRWSIGCRKGMPTWRLFTSPGPAAQATAWWHRLAALPSTARHGGAVRGGLRWPRPVPAGCASLAQPAGAAPASACHLRTHCPAGVPAPPPYSPHTCHACLSHQHHPTHTHTPATLYLYQLHCMRHLLVMRLSPTPPPHTHTPSQDGDQRQQAPWQ